MNPFQPPADDSPLRARPDRLGYGFIVDGRTLIAQKGAVLPDLCIYTGRQTGGNRVTKTFSWAPPALAFLILISALIYIIVYFIVRKTGTLDYALSDEARQRRTSGILLAVGGSVASVVLFIVGVSKDSPVTALGAFGLLLVALIVGTVRARVIHIAKIDDTHIHVRLRPEVAQAFAETLAR
jgi:hypothetical protein